MANRFGDPTAKYMGRITLSPFPHMDILGTFIIPCFGILSGFPVIGWGKPVPINPRNFHDERMGTLWVSAFGPLTNIVLAVLFAIVARILIYTITSGMLPASIFEPGSVAVSAVRFIYGICQIGVMLNLILAFFNLLPIPPLDGSGIIQGLLPYGLLAKYHQFSRYGMIVLLILLMTGALRYLLAPAYLVAGFLLP